MVLRATNRVVFVCAQGDTVQPTWWEELQLAAEIVGGP